MAPTILSLAEEPDFVKLDKEKKYAICRCFKTKTPPFCDGSHKKNG